VGVRKKAVWRFYRPEQSDRKTETVHNKEYNNLCLQQVLFRVSNQGDGRGETCNMHGRDEKRMKHCDSKT
jgi:hypothetical protein